MTAKNRIAKYLWTFIKYFSLILAGFIAVLPVASCVITAFKTPEEYASTNVMTLPGKFYFKNFIEAFQKANMGIAFLNSLIILVVVLFFSIMFGAMLAYILNRFTFPGRGIIKNLFLFAGLLPWYCNAGYCLQDHVQHAFDQLHSWLYYSSLRN